MCLISERVCRLVKENCCNYPTISLSNCSRAARWVPPFPQQQLVLYIRHCKREHPPLESHPPPSLLLLLRHQCSYFRLGFFCACVCVRMSFCMKLHSRLDRFNGLLVPVRSLGSHTYLLKTHKKAAALLRLKQTEKRGLS